MCVPGIKLASHQEAGSGQLAEAQPCSHSCKVEAAQGLAPTASATEENCDGVPKQPWRFHMVMGDLVTWSWVTWTKCQRASCSPHSSVSSSGKFDSNASSKRDIIPPLWGQ